MALAAAAVPLPWVAERLSTSDLFAVLSAVLLAALLFSHRRTVLFPWPLSAFLVLYGLSALANPIQPEGVADLVQRFLQLMIGTAIFSWLIGSRPLLGLTTLSIALGISTVAAFVQWIMGIPYAELRGLFPSRLAFCTFQALAILWCFPQWFNLNVSPRTRLLSVVCAALAVLPITHGQILVLLVLVLAIAFGLSDRVTLYGGLAALLLAAVLVTALPGRSAHWGELSDSLAPVENGHVKQAHVETLAACRMAWQNPWTGVGPGNYQKNIGLYYGELPNPNRQTIETNHQSAWGILAGVSGIPAGALLPGMLLYGALSVLLRFKAPRNARERQFVGGAALALGILILGWITDPFVRGTGWLVALAFASICSMHGGLVREMGWRGLALTALVALIPVCASFAKSALLDGEDAGGGVIQLSWQEGRSSSRSQSLAQTPSVAAVVEAPSASAIRPPMALETVGGRTAAVIPEGAGKPPPDRDPTMDDGGARFPLPDSLAADVEHTLWLHVYWEDGCGNSLAVRFGDKPPVAAGNDGIYNRWHWVRVPGTLSPQHASKVEILNREDGVAFSHVLFSSTENYVPIESP